MLRIWFEDAEGSKYLQVPGGRFNTDYEEDWVTGDFEKAIIRDVDRGTAIGKIQ